MPLDCSNRTVPTLLSLCCTQSILVTPSENHTTSSTLPPRSPPPDFSSVPPSQTHTTMLVSLPPYIRSPLHSSRYSPVTNHSVWPWLSPFLIKNVYHFDHHWSGGRVGQGVDRRPDGRWFESHFGKNFSLQNFGNSFYRVLPVSFGWDSKSRTGPFYLVSMPGEVKDPTSPHWNV